MKRKITILLLILIFYITAGAQVAISTDGSDPDESAIFDVKSNNKGMLLPRMTTSQRNAITNPANGLFIYNTDSRCLEFYDGMQWVNLCSFGGSVPIMNQTGVGTVIMDEGTGGTRIKNFSETAPNGEKEIYLGVPDLGLGAQRVEYDLCAAAGACWGTSMNLEFGYDPAGDSLWTKVYWDIDSPVESHQISYYNFSTQVASFGKTYPPDVANVIDIIAVCRDPGCSVWLTNIQIDGNPVGDVIAPYHPTDPWVHYYVTNYDFGSGFVLTGTLELIGDFTLGNEYSKIEIDFGYDIP